MKLAGAKAVRKLLSFVVRHANAENRIYLAEAGLDVEALAVTPQVRAGRGELRRVSN